MGQLTSYGSTEFNLYGPTVARRSESSVSAACVYASAAKLPPTFGAPSRRGDRGNHSYDTTMNNNTLHDGSKRDRSRRRLSGRALQSSDLSIGNHPTVFTNRVSTLACCVSIIALQEKMSSKERMHTWLCVTLYRAHRIASPVATPNVYIFSQGKEKAAKDQSILTVVHHDVILDPFRRAALELRAAALRGDVVHERRAPADRLDGRQVHTHDGGGHGHVLYRNL
jgi:hypothetical protein